MGFKMLLLVSASVHRTMACKTGLLYAAIAFASKTAALQSRNFVFILANLIDLDDSIQI